MLSTPSRQRLARIPENAVVVVTEGASTEQLVEVYTDPYIARVAQDHRPHRPIFNTGAVYLAAWVNGRFAGLFLAIQHSMIEMELHSLLKRWAIPYSRDLGRQFLAWAFSHPDLLRVTAPIIEGLESAKNYCLKLGFVVEGVRRNATTHQGKIKNVHILGMLREEWEAQV